MQLNQSVSMELLSACGEWQNSLFRTKMLDTHHSKLNRSALHCIAHTGIEFNILPFSSRFLRTMNLYFTFSVLMIRILAVTQAQKPYDNQRATVIPSSNGCERFIIKCPLFVLFAKTLFDGSIPTQTHRARRRIEVLIEPGKIPISLVCLGLENVIYCAISAGSIFEISN